MLQAQRDREGNKGGGVMEKKLIERESRVERNGGKGKRLWRKDE